MTEKKVKITGEVQIDGSQAQGEVGKINQGFAEMQGLLAKLEQGNGLILRSLASIAQAIKGMGAASSQAADASQQQAVAIDQAVDSTQAVAENISETAEGLADVNKEADKTNQLFDELVEEAKQGFADGLQDGEKEIRRINASASVTKGIFERIGHTIVDGVIAGIRSLASYLGSLIKNASQINAIFDKMGARGVKNIAQLRLQIAGLAGELGADFIDVAKSVELAESLGAEGNAVKVAEAAWKNYVMTGMEVNRQIEASSQIMKGFNLGVEEQVGLINMISHASQNAKVSQEMLWNGMASMGPRIQKLGGTFEDLINITTAGLSAGIKAEEEGLQGFNELISSLIQPSTEFGQKLVELGIIVTNNSPAWQQLKLDIQDQEAAFTALNAQIKAYRDEATEIGLLNSKAEDLINTYTALSEKKRSGETLNRLERKALRDSRNELESVNESLSKYDEYGLIVQNRQFKMMSTIEQVTERMNAAKNAQSALNDEIQNAEGQAAEMANTLHGMQASFTQLTETMQTEIPAAIQKAIGEDGLDAFIQKLGETPESITALSAEVQSLVTKITPALDQLKKTVGDAVPEVEEGFQKIENAGTSGFERMKTSLNNLVTEMMGPLATALDRVAQHVLDMLQKPFKDHKSMFEAVSAWSQNLGQQIIDTFNQFATGDLTLTELLHLWFDMAMTEVRDVFAAHVKPMLDTMLDKFREHFPAVRQFIIEQFKALAHDAGDALFNKTVDKYIGQPVQSLFYNMMDTGPSVMPTRLDLSDQAILDSGGSLGARGVTNNITVNGAGDPDAVADHVMRRISQQERLGNNNGRLN